MTTCVTGEQQSVRLLATIVAQTFFGLSEQTSGPAERVVLSPSVIEEFVLDAASALVELGIGQLHQMEGIGTWTALAHRVEDGPVGAPRDRGWCSARVRAIRSPWLGAAQWALFYCDRARRRAIVRLPRRQWTSRTGCGNTVLRAGKPPGTRCVRSAPPCWVIQRPRAPSKHFPLRV